MLKKILIYSIFGIAILGFVGMIIDFASGSPELEVQVQGKSLFVKNIGTSSIKILDVSVNDRKECTLELNFPGWSEERRHKAWVFGGRYTNMATNEYQENSERILKIGEVGIFPPALCSGSIVRAYIKTDQGSNTYEFSYRQ